MDPNSDEARLKKELKKAKKKEQKKNKKKKNLENINPIKQQEKVVPGQSISNGNVIKNGAIIQNSKVFADETENGVTQYHNNYVSPQVDDSNILKPNNIPLVNQPQTTENPAYNIEEDDSEDEGIEDYKIGGYHPIHVGEVLLERYVVIQKLGWGHFSTVWLCKDFKYNTYVAIKVQKSAPHYLEAAYDEVEILQKVARMASDPEWIRSLKEYYQDENKTRFTKDDCHVVQLLNSFIYQGPYGNHFCMVFEIMGVNLLEIIKRYNYRGVPMHLCRILAKQILIGLDYLHRICGIIHTDLKPENILICLTQEQTREIVENGQLSRSREYNARIREYQLKHGITIDEKVEDIKETSNNEGKNELKGEGESGDDDEKEEGTLADQSLPEQEKNEANKKKAKNARKKRYRQRKKQKELEAKLIAEGKDPSTILKNTQKDNVEKPIQNLTNNVPNEKLHVDVPKPTIEINNQNSTPLIQSAELDKGSLRGPKLDENVRVKIVDLGNACWTHHHFTSKIQTRQYRSPEVILGLHYETSADIWSFACTIFEMLTGDFLFEPRKGKHFKKNDDHFAQIIELLKLFPKKFIAPGQFAKKFFDRFGNLRRIQGFHHWSLKNVLTDKYQIKEHEADSFNSFLLRMLEYYPLKRASAQECLRHRWLKMPKNIDFKMSEQEYQEFISKKQTPNGVPPIENPEDVIYVESEDMDGDDEENFDEEIDDSDEEWSAHDNYGYQKYLNKSYDNGIYTGYAGGIKIGELDQGPNWQFDLKRK